MSADGEPGKFAVRAIGEAHTASSRAGIKMNVIDMPPDARVGSEEALSAEATALYPYRSP